MLHTIVDGSGAKAGRKYLPQLPKQGSNFSRFRVVASVRFLGTGASQKAAKSVRQRWMMRWATEGVCVKMDEEVNVSCTMIRSQSRRTSYDEQANNG